MAKRSNTLLNFFSLGDKSPLPPKKKATTIDLTKARKQPRGKKRADAPPPPVTRTRKVGRPRISREAVQQKVQKLKQRVKAKASGTLATPPLTRRNWGGQVGMVFFSFCFLFGLLRTLISFFFVIR